VSDDEGRDRVLHALGVSPANKLGYGGEAVVYAIDAARVVRVLHDNGCAEHLRRRAELVAELRTNGAPFALPELLEVGDIDGRVYAIERRLAGHSLTDMLAAQTDRRARARLVEMHLDAAAALGDLHLAPRAEFGDLIADAPITAPTWRESLVARAAASLPCGDAGLRALDPVLLAAALPDTTEAAFVHLDAFTGNMLTDGKRITAVIDIGATSVAGDRRLDPLAAAVYLASPDITPVATAGDLDVARGWLRNAGLDEWFEPAQRWLAAFWVFAFDDPTVMRWCRSVLLAE
jgi:aminoglycoside phosphotransferase (APT) family kinase protein